MQNKEAILEAINSLDIYTETARRTLKALVDISIDSVAQVSPTSLSKLLKIGRGVVYYNWRILQEDGIIKNVGKEKNRIGLYKLNETKLNESVEIFKAKQKYIWRFIKIYLTSIKFRYILLSCLTNQRGFYERSILEFKLY